MNQSMQEQIIVDLYLRSAQFEDAMKNVDKAMKRLNKSMNAMATYAKKNFALRKMNSELRTMKMNAIGTMFFMRMLSQTMFGFLKPAADAVGIMDLWNTTLQVLFIPIMVAILPLVISFMNFFISLPEPVQLAIGALTLFIGIFAGLSALFTSISLAGFFGELIIASKWVLMFSQAFTMAFAIIGLIIVGFVLAFQENFGKIKDWVALIFEGIKNIFIGAFEIIGGIWDMFMGILTGDLSMFKEGFIKVWNGMGLVVKGFFQFVGGLIVAVGLAIFRVVVGIYSFIYELMGWVTTKAVEIGTTIVKAIWDAIKSFFSSLGFAIGLTGKGMEVAQKGVDKTAKGASGTPKQDMIWRSGEAPISVNPNDTLLAFKNDGKGASPGGSGPIINMYNNIGVADKSAIEKILQEATDRITREVRRNTV